VFVVGCFGDQRSAAAVLFESEGVSRNPAPSRKARKGTAPGAASGIGAGGWPAEVTPTLNACFGSKQGQENQHINGGAGLFVPVAFDAFNQADTSDLSKTVASRNDQDTCSLVSGCWWNGEDIAGTLTKMNANGAQRMPNKDNLGAVLMRQREGKEGGAPVGGIPDVAETLIATDHKGPGHNRDHNFVAQPVAEVGPTIGSSGPPYSQTGNERVETDALAICAMQVRRLTPVECERLQGFPDNFTRIPWKKKPAEDCPDGPRYKALGNSMAVPCMKWIGERINKQAC
jgi:DNA (cytosine-5)-methyltransferase 1